MTASSGKELSVSLPRHFCVPTDSKHTRRSAVLLRDPSVFGFGVLPIDERPPAPCMQGRPRPQKRLTSERDRG